MEVKFYPETNEPIDKFNDRQITRIWFYYTIEIERNYGRTKNKQWKVSRTVTYKNVSEASKERLNKIVGKLVSNGKAVIDLFYGNNIGTGYEVEF